jgi:formylglycine-generating enzyme required for sulfatase activity
MTKTKKIFIDSSAEIDFAWVKGGSFLMGDQFHEGQRQYKQNNLPVHEVDIDSFCMSKYPVTHYLWCKIMGEKCTEMRLPPSPFGDLEVFLSKLSPKQLRILKNQSIKKTRLQNIINYSSMLEKEEMVLAEVIKFLKPIGPIAAYNYCTNFLRVSNEYAKYDLTWYQANDFANEASKITELKLRLPTEAEWEYAARSGGKKEFYAGGWDRHLAIPMFAFPVGWMKPNGLGLFDMSGSQEWVSDNFSNDYYQTSPRNNPKGPINGPCKVLRGSPGCSSRKFKGPNCPIGGLRLVMER